MADFLRQNFPIGDTINGQVVQTNKPLSTTSPLINWDNFASATVSTTVINLGAARGSHNRAYITVETNSIRYTVDGTLPTASLGHLLIAGSILELQNAQEVREFRTIRASADATIMVSFGNV